MATWSVSALAAALATSLTYSLSAAAAPPQGRREPATDLSLIDLMDTEVVSASLGEQSLAEAAAVIDVITQEEIQARGYRSIGEALQSVAGIDVTTDQYQQSVGVRGVPSGVRGWSRTIKVMIDGQPVSFRPSGENFLGVELVPLGIIDHIEIIRGPASALYGANAFLGVVNIITKNGYALGKNSVGAFYETGQNTEAFNGQASIAQQLGDFSILLGAAEETRSQNGYRLVELPGRNRSDADKTSITSATPSSSAFGRIAYDSERFGTFTVEGHFQRLYRSAEFADWGVMTHQNRLELLNGYGKLSYKTDWKNRLNFELSGAYASGGTGTNDHLSISSSLPSYIKRDLGYRGYDLISTLSFRFGRKSSVIAGLDASWDVQRLLAHYTVTRDGTSTLNPPASTQTGTRDFQNLGLFTNLTYYPFGSSFVPSLSDLGVAAGVRLDAHNIYGENGNARAGLVYDIEERHYIKLLFGTSYRAPSATQLFSNYIVPGGAIGNPSLRPERAQTIELALGFSPLAGLTLRADGYYTVIDDRVEIRRPPPSVATGNPIPSNSTPITSKGLEFQADFRSGQFNAFANYSLQASSYPKDDPFSIVARTAEVSTDAYPTHLLKGGITWTNRPYHFRVHVEGRYIGARLGNIDNNALVNPLDYLTRRYELPDYALADVTLATHDVRLWEDRESVFSVQIKNLFDSGYVLPGYSGFDIPGLSRSILVSLNQEL